MKKISYIFITFLFIVLLSACSNNVANNQSNVDNFSKEEQLSTSKLTTKKPVGKINLWGYDILPYDESPETMEMINTMQKTLGQLPGKLYGDNMLSIFPHHGKGLFTVHIEPNTSENGYGSGSISVFDIPESVKTLSDKYTWVFNRVDFEEDNLSIWTDFEEGKSNAIVFYGCRRTTIAEPSSSYYIGILPLESEFLYLVYMFKPEDDRIDETIFDTILSPFREYSDLTYEEMLEEMH